jgi:hypothetical protein
VDDAAGWQPPSSADPDSPSKERTVAVALGVRSIGGVDLTVDAPFQHYLGHGLLVALLQFTL